MPVDGRRHHREEDGHALPVRRAEIDRLGEEGEADERLVDVEDDRSADVRDRDAVADRGGAGRLAREEEGEKVFGPDPFGEREARDRLAKDLLPGPAGEGVVDPARRERRGEGGEPLAAGLGWTVKFDKGIDFIGRAALQAEKLNGSPRRVIFFRTGDRRIVRHDTPVLGATGATVGQVLSGTLSPILNEAIGSALVDSAATNQSLTAEIRGAAIALQRVQPPFIPLKKSP